MNMEKNLTWLGAANLSRRIRIHRTELFLFPRRRVTAPTVPRPPSNGCFARHWSRKQNKRATGSSFFKTKMLPYYEGMYERFTCVYLKSADPGSTPSFPNPSAEASRSMHRANRIYLSLLFTGRTLGLAQEDGN
jgi:hypothetical protein